jgi:isopentenyl-diphosphate Delta-isomerase
MEQVILVDHEDREIGLEEKMNAHQNGGILHRAFSIFVFNSKGQTMLQQRAKAKYHGGGLWSNTVCSHPRKGESVLDASHRRLREELGFDCEMEEVFAFEYEAQMDKELTEHEYDHVVFGRYDKDPKPNPQEVQAVKWVSLKDLKKDMAKNPKSYTPWLKISMDDIIAHYKSSKIAEHYS